MPISLVTACKEMADRIVYGGEPALRGTRMEGKIYTDYHVEPGKYVYHLALKIRHI